MNQSTIYEMLAQSHPLLERGQVWCHTCGRTQPVDCAESLRLGWPKCCGYTMSLDSPEERKVKTNNEEVQ